MIKSYADHEQNTVVSNRNFNAGFSLVELIIVVSILALAAIPLMKSMGMANKANAKAQSLQNATSVGEKIMEEMKSTPINTLKTRYHEDFVDGKMTINIPNQVSTPGETFDVAVIIDKTKYQDSDTFDVSSSTSATAKKKNVGSANTLNIPKIEDIDTRSQAVLTKKELNKYDTEALNYFNQKLKNYNPTPTLPATPVVATIKTKTVKIVKKNLTVGDFGVTVKATVTYTDAADNPYTRDIYAGTFTQQEESDGSKKHFDSNIYIFYTVGVVPTVGEIRETFEIEDTSNVTTFARYDPAKPMDSHRVYFIRQDKNDTTGPKEIQFSGTTEVFKFSVSDELVDGRKEYGDVELVTNLTSTLSDQGYIYKKEAKTRMYDITVELYKGSVLITTLNSTVTANDPV